MMKNNFLSGSANIENLDEGLKNIILLNTIKKKIFKMLCQIVLVLVAQMQL